MSRRVHVTRAGRAALDSAYGAPLSEIVLRLVDVSESTAPVETWRGKMADLVAANLEDVDTCDAAAATARDGIYRRIGGGALPLVSIEVVPAGQTPK